MNSIQDFITSAASSLGTSEDSTRAATGTILQSLQQASGEADFQQLVDKIPGASGLLGGEEPTDTGGGLGGGLGGALGQAASALGGGLGSTAGLLGSLQGSGLGADKLGPLVNLFMEFAKSKAGPDLVTRLLAKVPELAKLAG